MMIFGAADPFRRWELGLGSHLIGTRKSSVGHSFEHASTPSASQDAAGSDHDDC